MAVSTQTAKTPTAKKSPRARHYDTLAVAEKLVNCDEKKHYVFVPIDDPNTMGDFTAKGYEREMYSPDGVRPGAIKWTKELNGRAIERRGCVLMSIPMAQKVGEDKAALQEFDVLFNQIHKSRTGLRPEEEGPELGMRGSESGQGMLSVHNLSTPLSRTGLPGATAEEG